MSIPSTTSPSELGPRPRAVVAPVLAACLALGGAVAATPEPRLLVTVRVAQEAPPARDYLGKILDEVSTILLSDAAHDQKRDRVKELIDASVDFGTVSKLVLARNWKEFSDAQQATFIDLFKRHLLNTYWRNADYSDFVGIEITGDRQELRRDWTVLTRVTSKTSDDILIDYRLRLSGEEGDPGGEWHIIDILVEGVSLVSNFRSQFQSIVANDGPEKLLDLLRDKVKEAEQADAKAASGQ